MIKFMKKRRINISRTGGFEMAHRLQQAHTAACCETIHGHSYKWSVELTGYLREDGMLIDYGQLKSVMHLCEDILDHALWLPTMEEVARYAKDNKKLLCLKGLSPTAENMSVILAKTVLIILWKTHKNIENVVVTLHETDNSACTFVLGRKDLENQDFLSVPTLFDCRVEVAFFATQPFVVQEVHL